MNIFDIDRKHIVKTNLHETVPPGILLFFCCCVTVYGCIYSLLSDMKILQFKQYATDLTASQPSHDLFSNFEHRLHTDIEHCMQT